MYLAALKISPGSPCSPLSPRTLAFDQICSSRHVSPPMEQVSNPVSRQLVIPKRAMALLHQWAYLAWHVSIVAFRVYSWVTQLVTFLQLPTHWFVAH